MHSARITGTHHGAWLVDWDGVLLTSAPSWPQTHDPVPLASHALGLPAPITIPARGERVVTENPNPPVGSGVWCRETQREDSHEGCTFPEVCTRADPGDTDEQDGQGPRQRAQTDTQRHLGIWTCRQTQTHAWGHVGVHLCMCALGVTCAHPRPYRQGMHLEPHVCITTALEPHAWSWSHTNTHLVAWM